MNVDFNNIRKILISEYSELCHLLNHSPKMNESITVNASQLKYRMDSLRQLIGIIAATEINGRDDFKAVGETELPLFTF